MSACTLWAAAGESVQGGGTLIAKNRDWTPKYEQIIKLKTPEKGFRYVGLFEKRNETSGVKIGINEKGLVVVSASAIIDSEQKRLDSRTKGLNQKLLTTCSMIDEVLARKKLFKGPRFLLLADKSQIALVEIGLSGHSVVKVLKKGVLYHTNHFIEPEFTHLNTSELNPKKSRRFISSRERLNHIKTLITGKADFSLDDFIAISYSQDRGPDNSIWRRGKKPQSSRTLSTWIVWQPEKGTPRLFLRLADSQEDVKEYNLSVSEIFDHTSDTIIVPDEQ